MRTLFFVILFSCCCEEVIAVEEIPVQVSPVVDSADIILPGSCEDPRLCLEHPTAEEWVIEIKTQNLP
jgi:hypothetical protein